MYLNGYGINVSADVGCLPAGAMSEREEDQRNNRVQLTPGEQVRMLAGNLSQKDTIDPKIIGSWQTGTSRFQSEPLGHVITALEKQFGIRIRIAKEKRAEKFTGSFLHREVDIALKMVFNPMGLQYTKQNDGSYLVN